MQRVYEEVTPEYVKRLRKDMNMPTEKLAMLLGVTQNSIYNWEAGLSTPSGLHQIALNKLRWKLDNYAVLGDKKKDELTKTLIGILVGAGVIAAVTYLFADD